MFIWIIFIDKTFFHVLPACYKYLHLYLIYFQMSKNVQVVGNGILSHPFGDFLKWGYPDIIHL